MNFINPFGRKVGDGVRPEACMCNTAYSNAKGTDSCAHCGCDCGSNGEYHTGNKQSAIVTIRRSNA
ncbi:Apre_1838 family putative sactipeptide bacteriocin [Clostridium botulinum]|uniref:Apre_1838 family putative sactipeptide bacteriocin n=1 Tax=Clostridium botulinum TaxID=1491 RepID=UPI000D130905|nr:Apre_1838 family putative sactipeptide bacteriocin [Clostridium botulinum]AVQ44909.1 putative bacteriocin precursor [Clostridium botulinum]AVQ48980.1 putative bacteriocin precursor [Clostridium botulinum]